MWLIVSSLSLLNRYYLFGFVIYSCLDIVGPYGVIRKDSISLLSFFSFLGISKFSRVKFRLVVEGSVYIIFSFLFLFSGYFYSIDVCIICIVSDTYLSSPKVVCIEASTLYWMMACRLSLFLTYSLSVSSLGCKALGIIMSVLVLWSICWSSSLDYIKNSPEYLLRGTTPVLCLMVSAFNILKYL